MVVVTTERNGREVHLKMCTTHYGHQLSLGHYRKLYVAGQLAQGVSFQHILDGIRDSVAERFKRIHLITRKDIANRKIEW